MTSVLKKKLNQIKNNYMYLFEVLFFVFFNAVVCIFTVSEKNGFLTKNGIFITFLFAFISFCGIFLLKKINKFKIENKFLVFFLIIGVMYLFLFPMNATPDEGAHVYRAYEISEGHLVSKLYKTKTVGRMLPKNLGDILHISDYRSTFANLHKTPSKEREIAMFDNTALYSFVCYLPQAFGIVFARLFTKSMLIQLYFGRLFNFFTFTFLFYFAIKCIPVKKELLCLIAFLPITMQESISLAPDCLTIASSAFLISYIMYLRSCKDIKITKKELFLLTIICVVISQCKIVYLPLCLLVFLIPNEKFKSKKYKYLTLILMAVLVILLNVIWLKIASGFLVASSSGKSTLQVSYILHHPIKYLVICGNTINKNFLVLLFQSLGKYLSWFSILVPDIYIVLNLIIFFILCVSYEKNKCNIHTFERLFLMFVFLCVTALIFTSLYVQWTSYKASLIDGMQGRYYIPIMMLLPFMMFNQYITFKKDYFKKYIYLILLMENLCTLSLIVLYYI